MTTIYSHATAHPAYDDALRQAVHAAATTGKQQAVYFDTVSVYVREANQPRPTGSNIKLVCIAQLWDHRTVQLRFDGGRSEFIYI